MQDELLSPAKETPTKDEDSIDLENSGELDKIINKYEASLKKTESGGGTIEAESEEKERSEVEK